TPTCPRGNRALGFGPTMENPKPSGSSVVARFADGRVLKGTPHTFPGEKPIFDMSLFGNPKASSLPIPLGALKALFFVRSFEGDHKNVDNKDIDSAKGQGRKIVVTFMDGETICGFTP